MKQTFSLMRKEINGYFSSPMALIFVGVFLAATLFTFFWVDAFFSRNIADVRPMFRWMPILLIFLVGALTMRQWSEEARSGTLEMLLTLPAKPLQLVLGKFLGVLALVAVALALTFFLPLTVSLLGPLDWGPVIGGYLAAILLAAAYTAIGLFVSSRTDNQIVALILTVLVSGIFYLIGSGNITGLFGDTIGDMLRALGAGSRFESIERGVIDLRDLVYYLSLTALFLALNVLSLESKRWSDGEQSRRQQQSLMLTTGLLAVNLLLLNIWLYPFSSARLDLTENQAYSLAPATTDLLGNLQEPLLIRGYFSERTHPLLAPLVPRVRDMLREYEINSNGNVQIEIVDPQQEPELEAEANQTYGIQPTPLQAADRYGASIVNAYFDILVRYGDQSEVLNFRDLIEIQSFPNGGVDVRLRNLEYDLTRAVKRAVYGFQSVESMLAQLEEPARLTLLVTPNSLPEFLADAPVTVEQVVNQLNEAAPGQINLQIINPNDPNSAIDRQQLLEQYGIQPIPVALFSDQSYYLHMLLQIGDETQTIFPSGELTEANVRTAIEAAIKRASPGFLKVVGVWTPPDTPQQNAFGQQTPSMKRYTAIQEQLRQEYNVNQVDLSSGQVPGDIDVLLVIAPQQMSDRERFAIDQYLMRGGAVIVAAGNYALSPDQMTGSLGVAPVSGGLQEMLQHYGIDVQQAMVLDPQNEPFPVQMPRNVGGMQVMEIQAIDYPFFVDVRPDGMDQNSPILANLPAVTLNWVSPVVVDEAANSERQVTTLLESSSNSWLRTDTNIQPDLESYPLGFQVEGEPQSYPLAVSVRGQFESFFEGKESPLNQPAGDDPANALNPEAAAPDGQNVGVIAQSPETARLVVIGSGEFLNDIVFEISSSLTFDRYFNSLQLAQNSVDWAVEDLDLLSIRSGGSAARVLAPLTENDQFFWEGLNYAVALLAVVAIGFIWQARRRNVKPLDLQPQKPESTVSRDLTGLENP